MLFVLCTLAVVHAQSAGAKVSVPLGGNSWVATHSKAGSEEVTDDGWTDWTESDTVFSTYFYLAKPGTLALSGKFAVSEGESSIQCTVNGVSKTIGLNGPEREYRIGEWTVPKPGYVRVDIKGLTKTGPEFATVSDLLISGSAVDQKAAFVRNNDGQYFLWGRRGPSVHMNYEIPDDADKVEWFYNEVMVPTGNDVLNSYFMADGFDGGYFGMQVNSPTERRVLFSVWSPFNTDDPKNIPESQKIRLLRKGKNVSTGEFGNEGSGGQSFVKFNWKTGNTYKFLLRAEPVKNNYTNYTAWFFAPEQPQWQLIASFSRPATNSYLTGIYSFLENFGPETGNITRKAYYQNQWFRPADGEWSPITKATFTHDDTAKKGYRLDYSGGVDGGRFYLRNCGFFNDNTPYQSVFTHGAATRVPDVDLSKLE